MLKIISEKVNIKETVDKPTIEARFRGLIQR
jgi:hypothetical protein